MRFVDKKSVNIVINDRAQYYSRRTGSMKKNDI